MVLITILSVGISRGYDGIRNLFPIGTPAHSHLNHSFIVRRPMSPCSGFIPILIVEGIVPKVGAALGGSDQIVEWGGCILNYVHNHLGPYRERYLNFSPTIFPNFDLIPDRLLGWFWHF
jgi:hypothetical protein